jgi:hypothetical protein
MNLRNEFEQISLEDHNWSLKSWDQDRVGVVKVYCEEWCKDFGGGSSFHTKSPLIVYFHIFSRAI